MAWSRKLPTGKWQGQYRDINGKVRSAGTFTHKRAADKAASAKEVETRKATWRDPDSAGRPWGEWCEEWWPTRQIEPSTREAELGNLEKYVLPKWKDVALADITRQEVRAWIAELGRQEKVISNSELARRKTILKTDPGAKFVNPTISAATVGRIVNQFAASMSAAVDAEIIDTNPAYRAKLPRRRPATERYLTREEFGAVCEKLTQPRDKAIAALLAGTGVRWGEAVGLHAHRLAAARGMIRVAEVWDSTERIIKPYPKGRRVRDVPMPGWVSAQIASLDIEPAKACGHAHREGSCRSGLLLFGDGPIVDGDNWRARVWLPALEAVGVEHATVHDLRHTYASWLIQGGVSLEEVGRLLGHVSPTTTRRYAHLAETPKATVLSALEDPRRAANVQQMATPDGSKMFQPVPHPIAV